MTLLREQVLSMPTDQRAGALRMMEMQGLDATMPGRLRTMLTALEQGKM